MLPLLAGDHDELEPGDESGLRRIHRDPDKPTLRIAAAPASRFPQLVGRYVVSEPIASGGMASVHLGVRSGDSTRVLALKRLHPHLARDAYFTRMLLDESAIASRVRHPNVVTTYGAETLDGEVFLVMEYVAGLPLSVVMRRTHPRKIPPRAAAAVVAGALRGLHAAHEATDPRGRPLAVVHRDVSPQNILVGIDGVARVLDFGVAKAAQRVQTTRAGDVKGKIAYMAPEQLLADSVDRRTDIHAAGVVLWEALTGAPLFHAESEGRTVAKVLDGCTTKPSEVVPGIPRALDEIVMRALARRREDRFATALEMALALERAFASRLPTPRELGDWIAGLGAEALSEQARMCAELRACAPPRPARIPALAKPRAV